MTKPILPPSFYFCTMWVRMASVGNTVAVTKSGCQYIALDSCKGHILQHTVAHFKTRWNTEMLSKTEFWGNGDRYYRRETASDSVVVATREQKNYFLSKGWAENLNYQLRGPNDSVPVYSAVLEFTLPISATEWVEAMTGPLSLIFDEFDEARLMNLMNSVNSQYVAAMEPT